MACRCRECYGLAEYMLEHYGRSYGLPSAPGHALRVVETKPSSMTEISAEELRDRQRIAKQRKAFMWEEDYAA